jgi:hypothetical protein
MRDRKNDKAFAISSMAVTPFVAVLYISEFVIKDKFAPKTLIGAEGLLQMKKYCISLIEYHVAGVVFIFILTMLAAWLFRRLSGRDGSTRRKSIIAASVLAAGWLILFPMYTGCDVQAELAGCKGLSMWRVTKLLTKINADIDSAETEVGYAGKPKFANYYYQHSGNRGSGGWSEDEYGFITRFEKPIGQISRGDMKALNQGIYRYVNHEFKVFRNSRIIAEIDGASSVDDISHEVITLTYDTNTSTVYRDLICEDESELPKLYYVYRENGRVVGDFPANNRLDFHVPSWYCGKLEIWIEARDFVREKTVRVSNIITCEKTEYLNE